ncbi:hypothetical protein CYMTET_29480, partial [Cymbomonas tetramitiformis]
MHSAGLAGERDVTARLRGERDVIARARGEHHVTARARGEHHVTARARGEHERELDLKNQYLEEKENFWGCEMQKLEAALQEKENKLKLVQKEMTRRMWSEQAGQS